MSTFAPPADGSGQPLYDCCPDCGRPLGGRRVFLIGGGRRCLGCAVCYRPMLRRSTLTALVVGTVLIAINQGAVLLSGQLPAALAWQIPLTYLVPFCVASWGALSNSRAPDAPGPGGGL